MAPILLRTSVAAVIAFVATYVVFDEAFGRDRELALRLRENGETVTAVVHSHEVSLPSTASTLRKPLFHL